MAMGEEGVSSQKVLEKSKPSSHRPSSRRSLRCKLLVISLTAAGRGVVGGEKRSKRVINTGYNTGQDSVDSSVKGT